MARVLTAADLRCPVHGKQCYPDEATALERVEAAWTEPRWRNTYGRMPVRAYLCPDCGWWHLTARHGEDG